MTFEDAGRRVSGKIGLPEATAVELLDCTLRDGSYAVDFQLDEAFVIDLLAGLNDTSVTKIEVGHGIGLEAERAGIRPGNINHFRWCEIAASTLTAKPWGMFAQPDFTRLQTIEEMTRQGMSFVRIGVEPDRVQDNLDYLRQVTEICGEVYLNLMKTSATPVKQLIDMLAGVTPDVRGVYVVDSYGAMLPADVREYVTAVAEHFPVVGFHGHNNLGMANINTMAALDAGGTIVDGTLNGVGRGSGNAELESLAGIIKMVDRDRFHYRDLARLAEMCRLNMEVIFEDRSLQVLGGVIGIHSAFFPLVEELASTHHTDPATIMEAAVGVADQSPRKADFQAAADLVAVKEATV